MLELMTYPVRVELPGGTYHVNAKAVDGCKAFRDDRDRQLFLLLLDRELVRSRWTVLAYALMGSHYHVLVRLGECGLSSGFQHLNSGHARTFNRRHRRRGALWQRRFYDTLVETDFHLLEAVRYIALNPVRAGICERPEEYAWCSYGAAVGMHPADPIVNEAELLGLFGTTPDRARQRLREFVEEADPRRRRALLRR
jgi:REP element-mobilizing transposase RayT